MSIQWGRPVFARISWSRGKHTIQAGLNFRLITNSRNSFSSSYDSLVTNPSFYESSGDVVILDAAGSNIFPNLADLWKNKSRLVC